MLKTSTKRLGSLGWALGMLAVSGAGCGGGGGDAPPTPSALQVLARDGDTFPGGFEVGTLESANMSDDRTVAIIASERDDPSLNAVFLRTPQGEIRSILAAGDRLAEGLSFVTVRNMSMAPTGEFAFEVGNRLDNDGLFYWNRSQLSVLARSAPNASPEGFRILGAQRVASDGLVVFTAGRSPCEVDATNPDDPQVSCDLEIYTARNGRIDQVELSNTLTNQTPNSVLLQVNSRQEAAVGLSARGNEPLIGLIRDGRFEGALLRRAQLGDLGVLVSARPRAISDTGAIALDGFLDVDGDGARDVEHVMLYDNGTLYSVAQTGGTFEENPEVDVVAEGIDGSNQVIYRVVFDSVPAGTGLRSLRAWKNGVTRFIAHEGEPYGDDRNGKPQRILDIEQVRVGVNGDVVFVVKLGDRDPETGTRTISGTALIRWTDGAKQTLLELGAEIPGGPLVSDISIADMNSYGDLLLISSQNRSANRVLLLLPR